MRTRIKICGITRVEDALTAVALGVDALGLVFYEPSPRCITPDTAREIASHLPPFISIVGLFLNASERDVTEVIQNVPIDCLQFHGTESGAYCESFNRRYIKSVGMIDPGDLGKYMSCYPHACGFLLDAVRAGEAGGQGKTFDWNRVPDKLSRPLILAGGLDAGNVVDAIRRTKCYAVDVSSGVEESKGIKSAERMRAFVQQVNSIL